MIDIKGNRINNLKSSNFGTNTLTICPRTPGIESTILLYHSIKYLSNGIIAVGFSNYVSTIYDIPTTNNIDNDFYHAFCAPIYPDNNHANRRKNNNNPTLEQTRDLFCSTCHACTKANHYTCDLYFSLRSSISNKVHKWGKNGYSYDIKYYPNFCQYQLYFDREQIINKNNL